MTLQELHWKFEKTTAGWVTVKKIEDVPENWIFKVVNFSLTNSKFPLCVVNTGVGDIAARTMSAVATPAYLAHTTSFVKDFPVMKGDTVTFQCCTNEDADVVTVMVLYEVIP